MKMTNSVRVSAPMRQTIDLNVRYDKEWETHFLALAVTEEAPGRDRAITEEVTICLNNREEVDKLIGMLQRATRKIK